MPVITMPEIEQLRVETTQLLGHFYRGVYRTQTLLQ